MVVCWSTPLTHITEVRLHHPALLPLIIAFQLLTRIPTPQVDKISPFELGRSLLYYPIVGLVIGLILALSNWLLFTATIEVTAVLLLIVWVAITGALHLDGLGDSADAWVGGYNDRQRTLEIMKDPYCGPVAVCTILLVLLGKYASLQHITEHSQYLALIFIPIISRSFILVLFLTTPYVRQQGLGESLASHLPRRHAWLVVLGASITSLLLLRLDGLVLLVSAIISFVALRYWMIKRISGTTGDTAGAMVEILEMVMLLSFSLFCLHNY